MSPEPLPAAIGITTLGPAGAVAQWPRRFLTVVVMPDR
jgi:hypothetical protein